MHSYEAEQGLQYHERPVHLDSAIAGSITAMVAHLQREVQEAKDGRQEANDRAIDANLNRREAENQVAQLKRDLFKAEQGTFEARKTARKYEKLYHETLAKLEQAQAGDPTASNRADRVLIQSLEEQLNNTTQQLNPLYVGHAATGRSSVPDQ